MLSVSVESSLALVEFSPLAVTFAMCSVLVWPFGLGLCDDTVLTKDGAVWGDGGRSNQ